MLIYIFIDFNVLLIPLRCAGIGLNLTDAHHVVLVEPSMNIFLEAQAVGCVHRIGKVHPTYLHRVIVSYTIGDKILKLAAPRRHTA